MFSSEFPYALSDCDGTISNLELIVSPKTRKLIIKYQRKSAYHFSLVTGRLGASTKKLARELKISLPVISCNGALISDLETRTVLYAQYLPKDLVLKIIDECESIGISPFVYSDQEMVGLKNNPRLILWKKYQENLKKKDQWPILEFENFHDFKQVIVDDKVKPIQLLLYAQTKTQQEYAQEILKKYQDLVEGNQSLPFMFNITVKGVNKLTGLKQWSKIVGIDDYQDIITFGDNQNDLPMIQGVKKGMAVGNATDEVKNVAYKVVESMTDDGVGKELERIIHDYE